VDTRTHRVEGLRDFGHRDPRHSAAAFNRSCRHVVGECPVIFEKLRLNCESDWNPTSKAISETRRSDFSSSFLARSIRQRLT
jgi:hypothetical protein